MAKKQGFHKALPSPTRDESAIVALQPTAAKSLEAAPCGSREAGSRYLLYKWTGGGRLARNWRERG
jgi:hypothetical protein